MNSPPRLPPVAAASSSASSAPSSDPRRLLSHPHYIQKICSYINVRGDFAKAALFSHVNQGWDETLWYYQTLHTTFWNSIFKPTRRQFFESCHSLLKIHFQNEVDEMNEDEEEAEEEDEEDEEDVHREQKELRLVARFDSHSSTEQEEAGEDDSDSDDYDEDDSYNETSYEDDDDDEDDEDDDDEYDDDDDDEYDRYDDDDYDNDDYDDDYDETSSDEGECGRCPNCLRRRFVALCSEFNEASRREHSQLVRKLEKLIQDCPKDEYWLPVGEFRALPIFARRRASVVLKRLVSSDGFSSQVDFTSLNRQRLLIEGFLPYHATFSDFFHKSTEYFSRPPLFADTANGAKCVVNSLITSLLKESVTNEAYVHVSKKWDWFHATRQKDDEADRKLRASLSAPPPYFVFFKLGEAFFEHNEKALSWNPIMEAIRADNVEAFEAFVEAAATVALKREKKKKIDEAKRIAKNKESYESDAEVETDGRNNNNDGNDDELEQQLLLLDQAQIDQMKCSIVNDLESESSQFSFLRHDWVDHVHEGVRRSIVLPDSSQFTAVRVALICGSLNIFQHLTSGLYKTATALETVRPGGTSPHWLFVRSVVWPLAELPLPVCQTVLDLVHLISLFSATGDSIGNQSSTISHMQNVSFFTSLHRTENRKQIFRSLLKQMLERCLVVVVDKNGAKKILPSLESFESSPEWKFSHKRSINADSSSRFNSFMTTRIDPSATMTNYLVFTLRACLGYSSGCRYESTTKITTDVIFDIVHEFGGEDLVRKLLFEGALLPVVPGADETLFRQLIPDQVPLNPNKFVPAADYQSAILVRFTSSSEILVSFMNTEAFHECGNISSSSSSSPTFFSLLHKYLQEDPAFILANLDRHSAATSPLWCLCSTWQAAGSRFAVKTFEFLVKKTNANNVFSCKSVQTHFRVMSHEDRANLLHQIVYLNSTSADQSNSSPNAMRKNRFLHSFFDENRLKLLHAILKFVSLEHGYDKLHQFLNQRSEMQQFTPLHCCILTSDYKAAMMLVREFGADSRAVDAAGVLTRFMKQPEHVTSPNHLIFQHILDPKCDLSLAEIEKKCDWFGKPKEKSVVVKPACEKAFVKPTRVGGPGMVYMLPAGSRTLGSAPFSKF